MNTKEAETYFNSGLVKAKSEDYKGAIIDFDKAIELNPKCADVYIDRAVAKAGLGDNQGYKSDLTLFEELMDYCGKSFAALRTVLNL